MELNKIRNELSVKGKNGMGFLLSAVVIWSIITIIFLQSLDIQQKNIFMLFSTGLMFPLSVAMSTLLKVEWKFTDIPLAKIGLYLNLAQIIYFPILIWAIIKSPNDAIMIFAIIIGAHFFPYGWLYNTKSYYVMAPVISVLILGLGLFLDGENLWLIPLSMAILLLILFILNYIDYKKKA
ncbi:hypothetical protein F9U64_07705 [Gracilibacillus oryzae]|uniref:Uncharacterized protein n=1 Tax=Gracilibacillus oryzae TaxID=1672701 RepID=A0A7C8KUY0_9BACI|nr:hypothetical protein [Gracilibacillus oryzae]KAB8137813.1 hypothetical protein F9U64_07705 [Gracilibacillus oryzae]